MLYDADMGDDMTVTFIKLLQSIYYCILYFCCHTITYRMSVIVLSTNLYINC